MLCAFYTEFFLKIDFWGKKAIYCLQYYPSISQYITLSALVGRCIPALTQRSIWFNRNTQAAVSVHGWLCCSMCACSHRLRLCIAEGWLPGSCDAAARCHAARCSSSEGAHTKNNNNNNNDIYHKWCCRKLRSANPTRTQVSSLK